MIGIALRFAHALGLHIRNEDRTATVAQKEALLHTWWGLCFLEGSLSTIVGRPSFVREEHCSAPLPLPLTLEQLSDKTLAQKVHEQYRTRDIHQGSLNSYSRPSEPSNVGSYLKSMVQIFIITQRAMTSLYAARVITKSWKDVQEAMSTLYKELEAWPASLPSNFNFLRSSTDTGFQRQRMILHMQYIETQILITRPCMCRLDSRIPDQSKASDDFNKEMARKCVNAAKSMADLLSDPADAIQMYQIGPWWALTHVLMQALTILLLEMSYGTVHFTQGGGELLPSAKELLRSLRAMKENNKSAGRAYNIALGLLQKLASKIDADISDLLQEDAALFEEAKRRAALSFSAAGDFGPNYALAAGHEDQQHFMDTGMPASGYYDFQTGEESMFSQPYQEDPPFPSLLRSDSSFLAELARTNPLFGNSFSNAYDEHILAASDNAFAETDTTMLDFRHQDPGPSQHEQ
jgi:hypothetical protein